MWAIFRKELLSYFANWSAWIILVLFGLMESLFLFFFENNFNIFEIGNASMQSYFILAPWLFIFLIPALSMKSFAEEQQSGTLYWLFSQPVKIFHILLGKFFSVWFLGVLCLLTSVFYWYTIYTLGVPEGNVDEGMIFGGYLGLCFLISSFSAVGILASSLSPNQILAYLLGVFFCFFLYFGIEQLASYKLLGGVDYFLQRMGFYHHYITFTRGLMDSRDIFYFLLVVLLCLNFAYYFVKNKK